MAYKIYTKSNYFYIVDTENEKIYEGLSKDVRVRKEFVDSTDFIFENVNGFSTSISIPFASIQTEGGVAYADLATFVAFYEANTGNFNSGEATPQFIPLSGTTPENRVSGAIEFIPENEPMFKWNDELENKNDFFPYEAGFSFRNDEVDIFLFMKNGELNCNIDTSELALDNKLVFAQRAYVERPQTLINALNNCDVTQLATIKTILGII